MKVFIIGTGNVATALGSAVKKAGHQLTGVAGRDESKTSVLAAKLKCKAYSLSNKIPVNSDIYLVAIKDDAIAEAVRNMPSVKGIVAHTSGASPITLLKRFPAKGVFYPVETITKGHPKSFKKVPFCIEASDEKTFRKLMLFASTISSEIYSLDSTQRATLHVAAVFANNFTNYIFGIANDILAKQQLPSALLQTLAKSTVQNAFEKGAIQSQTGPAVRNDIKTIDKHLALLKDNKDYQQLYRILTGQIRNVHKKAKKQD